MYKAIKDDKIIAISDTDREFFCLVKDSVVEDTEHVADDYEQYNGEFLLKADIPVEVPTRSQMHVLRKQAYASTTDLATLERLRRIAVGEWTEQDEIDYIEVMREMSAEIKEKYPFKH